MPSYRSHRNLQRGWQLLCRLERNSRHIAREEGILENTFPEYRSRGVWEGIVPFLQQGGTGLGISYTSPDARTIPQSVGDSFECLLEVECPLLTAHELFTIIVMVIDEFDVLDELVGELIVAHSECTHHGRASREMLTRDNSPTIAPSQLGFGSDGSRFSSSSTLQSHYLSIQTATPPVIPE